MKTYVKPQIKFENYTMSESFATSCDMDTGWIVRGSTDLGTGKCYAETEFPAFSGMKFFNEFCSVPVDEQCYMAFSETAIVTYSSY